MWLFFDEYGKMIKTGKKTGREIPMKHGRLCFLAALLLASAMLFNSCGLGTGEMSKDPALDGDGMKDNPAADSAEEAEAEPVSPFEGLRAFGDADDMAYVLIYNPGMYREENGSVVTLSSGKFGKRISADPTCADRSVEIKAPATIGQDVLDPGLPAISPDTGGEERTYTPYRTGDVAGFNYLDVSDPYYMRRRTADFECVFAGDAVNVWIPKGSELVSKADAKDLADTFANEVCDACVGLFGEPRFAGNGHKINFLVHDGFDRSTMCFFFRYDLYSESDGLGTYETETYKPNYDHAILNVNPWIVGNGEYKDMLRSVLAHEFQHLICFSAFFENGGRGQSAAWLNEAMSGFAEEYICRGIHENNGAYEALAEDKAIRHGQSLYDLTANDSSIGAYCSLFLFSEYLASKGGEEVFHMIHDRWRIAANGTADAAAIRESMPAFEQRRIDVMIEYPEGFAELSGDETWLSKLTLDFYLELLDHDGDDPAQFEALNAQTLLYDEVGGAEIAGGGRVIVATADGTYGIPDDADKGLVYIGLDKDFNIITAPAFN